MLVHQILRSKPDEGVVTIAPGATIAQAAELLSSRRIGAVIVSKDGDSPLGILSERDYARKVVLLGRSSSDTPVGQIMSSPVITVSPTESIDDCMRVMTERRIRHLPVSQDGRVIGILSIGDLVKAVIDQQRRTIEELEHYIHS